MALKQSITQAGSIATSSFMIAQGIRQATASNEYRNNLAPTGKNPFVIEVHVPEGFTVDELKDKNYRDAFSNKGNNVLRLVMDVNPTTLSISYTPLINVTQTDGGFVEEHWGDEADSLSASGRSPVGLVRYVSSSGKQNQPKGFVEYIKGVKSWIAGGKDKYKSVWGDSPYETQKNASGLGVSFDPGARTTSKYYQMLVKLEELLNNQGFVYDENNRIIAEGKAIIEYEDETYEGRFTSFSVTESAESPFMFDYSFDFNIYKSETPLVRSSVLR